MPSPRRRSKARAEWRAIHYDAIGSGHDFFNDFEDDDARRAAYADMRDELLPAYIEECPAQRPRWWWEVDAPERRRCLNGVHPFDNPERKAHLAKISADMEPADRKRYLDDSYSLYFGVPRCLCVKDDFYREYESEPEYLARLNLLTEEEAAYLAEVGDAWEPRKFDAKKWSKEPGAWS